MMFLQHEEANVQAHEPAPMHDMAAAPHEGAPAEHAAPAHGGAHEGAHEGPGHINWFHFGDKAQPVPYIALFINFAILVALIVKMGKKPISESLVARRDKVAKDIEEAARMKAEATERAQTYKAQIDGLAKDAEAAKQTMLTAGAADKQRVVAEAEAAAVRMNKDAQFSVEQQRKSLAVGLHAETSASIAKDALAMLRASVTPADHERLAEQFLVDLESVQQAKGAA